MPEGTNSRIGKTRRALRVVNSTQGNTPHVATDPDPGAKWINFGRSNLFPEFVTGLVHNFQPILSGIDTMSLYLAGTGIDWLDASGKPIQAADDKWIELTGEAGPAYFMRSVFKDLVLMGARSFEVVYNGAQQPAALHHLDVTRLRCAPKDGTTGKVPAFHWCSNWELRKAQPKKYPALEIANWETLRTESGPKVKGVSYGKLYTPGQDYYGWPWWVAALTDIEVGARIPHFNRTQLDTGFRPAFHIHVFTDRDDVDLDQLDADVEAVWTGVDGKTYVVTHGTVAEGAPQLTKLERGDHAGELDKMGDRAELIAYKAVGVPPVLMGIDVNTGMSGKGLAIEQTVTMFQRMRCMPLQDTITADLVRIMQACGIPVRTAKIRQLSPFDQAVDPVLQRQTYIARTTLNMDLVNNGLEPRPAGDPLGNMLLCDLLRGAGNLDPAVPNA